LNNFLRTQASRGYLDREDNGQTGPIESLYTTLGRPSHGKRTEKLYKIFNSMVEAKVNGTFLPVINKIIEVFSLPLIITPSEEDATLIFKEVKESQLMNDMDRIQTEA